VERGVAAIAGAARVRPAAATPPTNKARRDAPWTTVPWVSWSWSVVRIAASFLCREPFGSLWQE